MVMKTSSKDRTNDDGHMWEHVCCMVSQMTGESSNMSEQEKNLHVFSDMQESTNVALLKQSARSSKRCSMEFSRPYNRLDVNTSPSDDYQIVSSSYSEM